MVKKLVSERKKLLHMYNYGKATKIKLPVQLAGVDILFKRAFS